MANALTVDDYIKLYEYFDLEFYSPFSNRRAVNDADAAKMLYAIARKGHPKEIVYMVFDATRRNFKHYSRFKFDIFIMAAKAAQCNNIFVLNIILDALLTWDNPITKLFYNDLKMLSKKKKIDNQTLYKLQQILATVRDEYYDHNDFDREYKRAFADLKPDIELVTYKSNNESFDDFEFVNKEDCDDALEYFQSEVRQRKKR